MAGQVVGGDRARVGIVLIEPDRMREIGAVLAQQPRHPLQHVIGFAAAPVMRAVCGKSRRPADTGVDLPGLPVEGLVSGQEDPWPGLDRTGIRDRHTEQLDRFDFQRHPAASAF